MRQQEVEAVSQILRVVPGPQALSVLICFDEPRLKVRGGAHIGHLMYSLGGPTGNLGEPSDMARQARKGKPSGKRPQRGAAPKSDYFTQPGKRGAVIVLRKPIG